LKKGKRRIKMKTHKILTAVLILGTVLIFGMPAAHAVRILSVPYDFASVQEAIDDAVADDIVFVYPGTYSGNVAMKADVDVFGMSRHGTVIESVGGIAVLGAGNTTLENLTVKTTVNASRLYQAPAGQSNIIIKGCAFIAQGLTADCTGIEIPTAVSAEVVNNSVYIKGTGTSFTGINFTGSSVLCANNSLYIEGADTVQGIVYDDASYPSHIVRNNIVETHNVEYANPQNSIAVSYAGVSPADMDYNLLLAVADPAPASGDPSLVGTLADNVNLGIGTLKGIGPDYVRDETPAVIPTLSITNASPARQAADPNFAYASGVVDMGIYEHSLDAIRNGSEIQALIDAAAPGDTVTIPDGLYKFTSHLWIKKNIILQGNGRDKAILEPGRKFIFIADPAWYNYRRYPYSKVYEYKDQGFATVNDVTLQNLTIRNASHRNGGRDPIRNYAGPPLDHPDPDSKGLKIKNCKIINNKGGAASVIFSWTGTNLTIENTLIANSSNLGWAGYIDYLYGGGLDFETGENHPPTQGDRLGGVIYLSGRCKLTLKNSTIAGNFNGLESHTTSNGRPITIKYGAIVKKTIGTVNIENSILWDNGRAGVKGQDITQAKVPALWRVNISSSDMQMDVSNLDPEESSATDVIQIDPEFVGGAPFDYTLQSGSPATGMGPSWLQP
jgi:hypothetical protein